MLASSVLDTGHIVPPAPKGVLCLRVSAKVALTDRTMEEVSGLCRDGLCREGLSRRESRSCFAYSPILFSTSYSSICICLVLFLRSAVSATQERLSDEEFLQ